MGNVRRILLAHRGRLLLSAGVIGAFLIVSFVFIRPDAVEAYPPGPQDFKASTARWESEIKRYGGARAYQRLVEAMVNLSNGQKHGYAHIFGEALYRTEGLAGFEACDSRFAAGCHHQFMGTAFQELGAPAMKFFIEKCSKGCSHALGHVVLLTFGFTEPDLLAALEMCETFNTRLGGCVDGAIMEYNIRDVVSGGSEEYATARPLTLANRYGLCKSLPQRFRPGCAFQMPRWWSVAANPSVSMRPLLSSCHGLGEELLLSCASGVGYLMGGQERPPEEIVSTCSLDTNRPVAVACMSGAAWRERLIARGSGPACGNMPLSPSERVTCEESAATFGFEPFE